MIKIFVQSSGYIGRGGKAEGLLVEVAHQQECKPVAQAVRRLPFVLRDKVDEKLDDLLAKDIIEEVANSPNEWVSPLVVVTKSDGDQGCAGRH